MERGDFSTPNGVLVKNDKGCYSFVPNKLPRTVVLSSSLTPLLVRSHSSLASLSGYGETLPNPHLLIGTYIRNEAVESSRIEGTKASLEDLVRFEVGGEVEKDMGSVPIDEVRNYVHTIEEGMEAMSGGGKINKTLLLGLHKTLMKEVRCLGGRGQFRVVQNFLGHTNDIQLATYVPPTPKYVDELMDDLFDFIQNPPSDMPPLVQAALIHYQFEAIHPFLDGNGRIGRLLITLYLCGKGHLSQPLIYLSEFFEKNKTEYYYRLLKVSQESQLEEYIRFFLTAVDVQSRKSSLNIKKLTELSNEYHKILAKENMNTHQVVNFLFARPATTINDVSQAINVTYMTAKKIVKRLEQAKILEEATGRKRNKVYVARQILNIIQE